MLVHLTMCFRAATGALVSQVKQSRNGLILEKDKDTKTIHNKWLKISVRLHSTETIGLTVM